MTALWQPTPQSIAASNIEHFRRYCEERYRLSLPDYWALHRFSVDAMEKFWDAWWDFSEVRAGKKGSRILIDADQMPGARFFPEAELNFAENLLVKRDESDAIVFWAEEGQHRRLSWRALYDEVSRLAQALSDAGLKPGERCAGFVPNMPETVIAMLAVTALGGIWTSCSPDFGAAGVLDRFGQSRPKFLFAADGYRYAGKRHESLPRVAEFVNELASVERTIVFPHLEAKPDVSGVANAVRLEDFVRPYRAGAIPFHRLPFLHPLYIMYSSGTTGVPKCILHSAGGALITHTKEHRLHFDVKPGDRVFYFTTLSWMMWNWLTSALASGATILLYDGSPSYPTPAVLFDFAERERMTLLGLSAKFVDAARKAGLEPAKTHDLSSVKMLVSTGSPLVPEGFDYVHEKIKSDVPLISPSGGTDLLAAFVGGSPLLPVYRGQIQCPLLGMAVDVFDEEGRPLSSGKGELVCTRPFPSLPIGFWNDPGERKYRAAYFDKFPGVWCHGDFCEWTAERGMIIYGRSDATLNPGGVRIGTAEIYRQVERVPEVAESIVIGQEWEGDTRIVLFVRLKDGAVLDAKLKETIERTIRENATPRHVPAKLIAVADIPRTKSGKIVELAVREAVHGRAVKNREALANPEALEFFRNRPELKEP